MPASTTDDFLILTVGDDNVDIADPEHAACTPKHVSVRRLLVGGTQWMPLSAAIKQRLVWGAHGGTGGIVLLAARTKDAFRPPAQWWPALPSAPRSSAGAEACMPIEADLEAFSPGRTAAHDGHGRLAEGERAF